MAIYQILQMPIAFRPRRRPASIFSRYIAQALAEASTELAGDEFCAEKPVITRVAGFAFSSLDSSSEPVIS
jgi:hypothetical protein